MTTTAIPYFLYAFGILLREGLEALLVVVALAAGVRQMGRAAKVREIYFGAVLGIAVSLLLAWGVNVLITDNASDAMEGAFQIVAALTLFYVSSWLTAKTQASRWQDFLQKQLPQAGRRSIPLAFGLSAFLAVLREGAETIVFFQALLGGASAGSERQAIWAGMGLAAVALALVFFGLQGVLARIPLRHFFRVTSILLYGLAVVFIGQAVGSLQEANVVGATFISHLPTIPVLGIFPTVQSLAAQTVLLALAVAAWFAPRHKTNAEASDLPVRPRRTASVRAR